MLPVIRVILSTLLLLCFHFHLAQSLTTAVMTRRVRSNLIQRRVLQAADDFIPPGIPPLDIWVGSIVSLIPIIWASFEFSSRIQTQQRCLVCQGSGLVFVTKSGAQLRRARKCNNCGGFLPWLGWRRFFLSTFDPGNGGVLQRPLKPAEFDKNNRMASSEKGPDSDRLPPVDE